MGKIFSKFSINLFTFLFLVSFNLKADCVYEHFIKAEDFEVGIMLSWSTAMENENELFIIEKSEDGIEFSVIGSLKGAGNSEKVKKYNFLDIMANEQTSFYRLKQVDIDGTSSYSDILATNQSNTNQFMVVRLSAAVTSDSYEVTFDASVNGQINYILKNWDGSTVFTKQQEIIDGLNVISVDLKELDAGVYKLDLQLDKEVETLTFKKINREGKKKNNIVVNRK